MNDKKFIQLPLEKIADFCKRNRIRKLSLFGSALKGELRKDSDIDFLVEFQPGEAPSLLDLARMERDLSTLLDGRKVDLRTPNELSATSVTKYSPRPVFNMRKDFVAEIRSSASRAFARDKIRTLFFHALAVLVPCVDAGLGGFLVNALG